MDTREKALVTPYPVSLKDKTISEPHRFMIMLVLCLNGEMEFTELQQLLDMTPGNLDHHIKTLIKAG
ncbi:MAG: ArsR/SmtB family transcription factor, partial [Candidatus Odinarchaeota archaeon]